MNMILKRLSRLPFYLFGITIGKLYYDAFIFKGYYFSNYYSSGWSILFKSFIWQKFFGINKNVRWPVSHKIIIQNPENISFHPDDLKNFLTQGNYFQAIGAKILIGKGTFIAPNVGIFTENHDLHNPAYRGMAKEVMIGEKCWIGMNSVILPGTVLGDHTVVGAGAIVTKSFPEGHCVIAGNPARKIKDI